MGSMIPQDADAKLAKASATLNPSHKKEYISWIEGAKMPETRIRRVKAAVKKIGARLFLK